MTEHKSWKKQHKSLKNHGNGGHERQNFPDMMQHKRDGKSRNGGPEMREHKSEFSGNEGTENIDKTNNRKDGSIAEDVEMKDAIF